MLLLRLSFAIAVVLVFTNPTFSKEADYPVLENLSKTEATDRALKLLQSSRRNPLIESYDSLEFLVNYYGLDILRVQYYLNRGRFEYRFNQKIKKGLQYLNNAYELAKTNGQEDYEMQSMIQIAQLYNLTSINEKSVDYILQVKQRAEELNDSTSISAAYFLLAQANPQPDQYCIDMFKNSLRYYGKSGRNLPKIIANIGHTFILKREKQPDSAIYYLKIANAINDTMMVDPSIKTTLAEAYIEAEEFNKADSLLNITLKNAHGESPYLLSQYAMKVDILQNGRKYDEALKYIDKGLLALKGYYFDDYDIKDFCVKSKETLFKIGDLDKLFLVDSILTSAQDSILMYIENANTSFAKSSYQIAELEAEMKEKEHVISKSRALSLFLVIVLLALGFILRQFIRKKKLQEKLEIAVQQSDEMSRENKKLEDQLIAQRIDQQERQLSSYATNLIQKNEALTLVLNKVKKYKDQPGEQINKGLQEIVSFVESSLQMEDQWKNFLTHFENIHPDFFQRLN
ncbi:MAG: hypothetical protein AAFQ94_13065, partial [Bacteroidota bacterium]